MHRSVFSRGVSVYRRAHHPLERQDGALGTTEHLGIDAARNRIPRPRHGELGEQDDVGLNTLCRDLCDERIVRLSVARLKRVQSVCDVRHLDFKLDFFPRRQGFQFFSHRRARGSEGGEDVDARPEPERFFEHRLVGFQDGNREPRLYGLYRRAEGGA